MEEIWKSKGDSDVFRKSRTGCNFIKKISIFLISLALLFASCLIIFPENKVSGLTTISSDTTWSTDQIISDDMVVAPGVTLWINPGVNVTFSGYYYLRIEGYLYANGTKQQPINFTSATKTKGDWFRLLFFPGSSGSLNWTNMDYADTGLTIASTGIVVKNTTVSHISGTGIEIVASQTNNRIRNCIVYDTEDGISIEPGSDWNEILNCTIYNSNSSGIKLDATNNNTVADNTLTNNRFGIECTSSNDTIIGNIINESKLGMIFKGNSNANIYNTYIINSNVSSVFTDTGSSSRFYNCTMSTNPGSNLDIVVGNDVEQNVVYIGNGDGTVTVPPKFGTGSDNTSSVALGYLDSNSALDMIVGNNGEQNVVYMGDGDGTFDTTSHNFGTGIDNTTCVALGDMNDDTILDIVIGNYGEQNVIYLGDGDGTFDTTSYNFGTGTDSTTCIALGNLDGDTDLDILVGNYGEVNAVYYNLGGGSFMFVDNLEGHGGDTTSVALGDVNDNGVLDAVVGNYGGQNRAYLNMGSFMLSDNFGTGTDATTCVVFGDMNYDTKLDIIVGNDGEQNIIYRGDGDGTFDTTSYYFGTGSDATSCIALGEADDDWYTDIVVGNDGEQNVVYFGEFPVAFTTYNSFGTGSDATASIALGEVNYYETDFYINGDSHPWVLNTTFNKTAATFLDSASNLTVNWYMHTKVVDVDYAGVGSATLWVNDSLGKPNPSGPFTTDASGWVKWIVVTEYVENATNGKVYNTPHNASAKEGMIYGHTLVNMFFSQNIIVVLDRVNLQIPLMIGWNMISVPMNQSDKSLTKVLQDIDGDYSSIQRYNITDGNDPWKHYIVGKPFGNDLQNIDREIGIWIFMLQNNVLNLVGSVPIPTITGIQLKAGWNFVGYPSLTPRTAGIGPGEAFETISAFVNIVQYYNASDIIDPWKEWDIGSYTQDDLIEIKPGYGLWIHVTGDCIWNVDW